MNKKHLTLVHSITEKELKQNISDNTNTRNEKTSTIFLIVFCVFAIGITLADIYSKEIGSKSILVLLMSILIVVGLYQTIVSFLFKFSNKKDNNFKDIEQNNKKLRRIN